jgi:catechol 2,3-dioxygenase-like lactoylglutathione lyase family enzyme
MIEGLSHACYVVNDLEVSLEFYRDGLGLPVAFEYVDESGKPTGAYVYVGERTFIELFEGDAAPAPGDASYRHISLEVEDMESTVVELRGRGLTVTGLKMGNDNSWQAWLTDPDGNRIELQQFTEESRQVEALQRLRGD